MKKQGIFITVLVIIVAIVVAYFLWCPSAKMPGDSSVKVECCAEGCTAECSKNQGAECTCGEGCKMACPKEAGEGCCKDGKDGNACKAGEGCCKDGKDGNACKAGEGCCKTDTQNSKGCENAGPDPGSAEAQAAAAKTTPATK